jgi:hypothetical protein
MTTPEDQAQGASGAGAKTASRSKNGAGCLLVLLALLVGFVCLAVTISEDEAGLIGFARHASRDIVAVVALAAIAFIVYYYGSVFLGVVHGPSRLTGGRVPSKARKGAIAFFSFLIALAIQAAIGGGYAFVSWWSKAFWGFEPSNTDWWRSATPAVVAVGVFLALVVVLHFIADIPDRVRAGAKTSA